MKQVLLKPLVYLLVFGLLGCTSTNWTALDEPAGKTPIPLVRITLTDGVRFEMTEAVVTDELVSGMRIRKNEYPHKQQFSVPAAEVQTIEIGDRKIDGSKSALIGVGVIAGIAALIGIAFLIICSDHACIS